MNVARLARPLLRHRAFAIVAIVSLALGIALNTTMYSVLDAMINPPSATDNAHVFGISLWGDAHHHVDDATRAAILRAGGRTYDALAFSNGEFGTFGAELGDRFAQVNASTVSPNYLSVVRARLVRGRSFETTDIVASTPPIIIASGMADLLAPAGGFAIGTSVLIDGTSRPVIGIVKDDARSFYELPPASVPLSSIVPTVLRVRHGASFDDAQREIALLSARFARLANENPLSTSFQLRRAPPSPFHFVNFHYALIASVVAVLLVASANLANLQLARGLARSRELALRTALGASRRAIVGQLVAETALLAAIGTALGAVATFWSIKLVAAHIPPSIGQYILAPRVSWRLLAVAIAAGVLCTIIVGLYPAIRVSRVDPNELLKSGAGTGANRRHRRQYGYMVAAEIALSLALLAGAAIVVRTANRLRDERIGFDYKPLSAATIIVRAPRDTALDVAAYAAEMVARLRAAPNVAEVAAYTSRFVKRHAITVDAPDMPPQEYSAPNYHYSLVTPAYFRVYDLPIVKGRDFIDGGSDQDEVIVDEQMARRLWPGVDPIGRQLKLGEYKSDAPWVRVVGVVGARATDPGALPPDADDSRRFGVVYLRQAGHQFVQLQRGQMARFDFAIRARKDAARMPVAIRRYLPHDSFVRGTMTGTMEETMGLIRDRQSHDFVAGMFALFAALAVGLCALGIYGIVNHSVVERKRELGVRVALGATARDIVYVVMRDGLPMVLAGVALGLYLIKRTVPWLHAFSVENDQYDAPLFAAMALGLCLAAVLSALIPAMRATRIDPVESLRSE